MENTLSATASIGISRPVAIVFEAIVAPDQMNGYFIAQSTGRLETDKEISWTFPEFDDRFPVVGKEIRPNEYISFDWSGGVDGMLVEIFLEATASGTTVVRIKEGQMANDEAGIRYVIGQTEGWANFLACLKAFLEYGINLRTGAFDFMKDKRK